MIQEPSYHLEGVVHARDELEDFTGPLDLILMLLAKDKIEIRDIQISQLLDQYLAYLQKMQEMDLEIASEFVQMASHLMYIKTKMLLTEEKEPTELEVLVSALEQLKNRDAIAAVREAAPEIGQLSEVGMKMQTRGPLPLRSVRMTTAIRRRNCSARSRRSCSAAPANRLRRKMKRCAVLRRSRSYSAFGKRANSCSAFSGKTGICRLTPCSASAKAAASLLQRFCPCWSSAPTGISASAEKKEITM